MDSGGGGCEGWVEVFGGMDGRKSIGGEGVQIVYLWVTRQDWSALPTMQLKQIEPVFGSKRRVRCDCSG